MDKNLRGPLLEGDSNLQGADIGVNDDDVENESFGCMYGIYRYFGWSVSKEKRSIKLDGHTIPSSFPSNKLANKKYTVLTFLPILLYNEFKFFFNMFFLLIALS